MSLDKLQQTFINVLDKHAPMKYKYTRANQAPFMNKFIQKVVMNRSRPTSSPRPYVSPE